MNGLSAGRVRLARGLAIGADVVQIGLFPLFGEGVLSVFNDVLDVVLAVVMFRLLGWHWALLPSVVAELVPGVNLFPTWTVAVLYVTRRRGATPPTDVIDVEVPRQGP